MAFVDKPRAVQVRYWSRRLNRRIRPYVLRYSWLKIKLKERKNTKVLDSALSVMERVARKNDDQLFPASALFLNLALYFLIINKDIQMLKIDAIAHPDDWRRSICLRVMALTIHEWDVGKVTGKKLSEAMDSVELPLGVREEVRASLRLVNKSQQSARKALKGLRNSVIAHRDANALEQYRMINNLPAREILQAGATFYEASNRFHAVLPKLIEYGGSRENLFKQMLSKDLVQRS